MSPMSLTEQPVSSAAVEHMALLERVINSQELKRALRLRELLCFLGNRALQPHPGTLREQEIGAAVFGRHEDYDTSLDNIVRVNVSELRKRLAHYFEQEGVHEPIVIQIPRGGYLPVFVPRASTKEAEPSERSTNQASDSPLDSDHAAPPFAEPLAATQHHRPVIVILITLLIALLATSSFLLWQNHRLAVQLQPWKSDPVIASLWSEFFASGDDVDIVTADTSFAMTEDILGHKISLSDYLDYHYKAIPDQPGLTPETRSMLKVIMDRNNGSVGDFQAAKRFMDLDGHSPAIKLDSARSYTPESIKANNVILIGGRQSNPWVDLYKDRLNFFMDYDPSHQRPSIVNRAPAPGEKAVYQLSDDPNHSYSVVAFLPNFGDNRYAIILSGTDSQATRAAGEFITSTDGLSQIRQKLPTGRFPFFELLLSSSRLEGTTLNTEIVAYRVHPR